MFHNRDGNKNNTTRKLSRKKCRVLITGMTAWLWHGEYANTIKSPWGSQFRADHQSKKHKQLFTSYFSHIQG